MTTETKRTKKNPPPLLLSPRITDLLLLQLLRDLEHLRRCGLRGLQALAHALRAVGQPIHGPSTRCSLAFTSAKQPTRTFVDVDAPALDG